MAYDTLVNKTTTNGLPYLQQYKLRRTALEALMPNFPFYFLCNHDELGLREGKTLRWYRWMNPAANTTAITEGAIPTGIAHPTQKILDATISQYGDYMAVSDLLRDTAPEGMLQAFAKQLGFRAGLSGNNIVRAVLDGEASAEIALQGTYLTAKDSRAQAYILFGRNVMKQKSGWFEQIVHPYNAFDIVNDPSSAGLLDLFKYTNPEKAAATNAEERGGELARVSGVRIRTSTSVKETAGTPTKWRSYLLGNEAIGTVNLSSQPFNQIADPMKEVFSVKTKIFNDISEANPMGTIGAIVSYKFTLVAKVLSGPSPIGGSFKYAWTDAPSSIVA